MDNADELVFDMVDGCPEAVSNVSAIAPEYDSGYITNNQESNSENSVEAFSDPAQINVMNGSSIYISEDALLEQPTIKCNIESFSESGCHDSSYGSIVEGSVSNSNTEGDLSGSIAIIDPISVKINQSSDAADETNKPDLVEYRQVKTPENSCTKPIDSNVSPDLFSDEDDDYVGERVIDKPNECIDVSQTQTLRTEHERAVRNDKKLLRRVQEALNGVLPPPSITVLQLSAQDMLDKIKLGDHLFLSTSDCEKQPESAERRSLLITNTWNDVGATLWPDLLHLRYHGLLYNRGKVSEDFEDLCGKYASRYVGVETASTCILFSSAKGITPSKKKSQLRWGGGKSPGRRLSHLARRRITFSSSNLQASNRQILIDSRRPSIFLGKTNKTNKSPRKTPRKSPKKKIRTPGSSSKKARVEEMTLVTARVSTTKRALFQSPESASKPSTSSGVCRKSPRKALFLSPSKGEAAPTKRTPKKLGAPSTSGALRRSPRKHLFPLVSPHKSNADGKRKRTDSEDCHPNKISRSMSFDVHTPNEMDPKVRINAFMRRHNSEVTLGTSPMVRGDLSDVHKKKLLWAVSEALRTQKISMSHPKFKEYASILARVTRRFMPDLLTSHNGPRMPGSTSDRMLKIARQCVYQVIKGHTVDDIVQNISNAMSMKAAAKPATGYVSIGDKENVNATGVVSLSSGDDDDKKSKIRRNINFEDRNNLEPNR